MLDQSYLSKIFDEAKDPQMVLTREDAIQLAKMHVAEMGNQQPSSCDESLEKAQRLLGDSYGAVCKICGYEAKARLYWHLNSVHQINANEYKSIFPGSMVVSKSEQEKMARTITEDANPTFYSNPDLLKERNQAIGKGRSAYLNSNPKAMSEFSTKGVNKRLELLKDDSYHSAFVERQRKSSKERWDGYSPSEKLEAVSKMVGNLARYKDYSHNGITYKLQSHLEFTILKGLMSAGLEYGKDFFYNGLVINLDGYNYHPDFWIPSMNLVIEAKGQYLFDSDPGHFQSLSQRVADLGYRYLLIVNWNKSFNLSYALELLGTSGSAILGSESKAA